MTEYDFSPEAYERYIHTQQRIATWVDQTEEHRPEFGTAIGTPSSHQGTPPMLHPMPLYERGNHSTYERRRPSFSSSSDSSSSSSTGSSDYLPKASAPMPAQPMYLQHAVANPLHSNRPHHSNPQRHHYGRQSSHVRSVPRSFSRGAAAPTIYGHNNGHVLTAQLKGMSLVVGHFLISSDVTADCSPRPRRNPRIINPHPPGSPDTLFNKLYIHKPSLPAGRFTLPFDLGRHSSPSIQLRSLFGRAPIHSMLQSLRDRILVLQPYTHSRLTGPGNLQCNPRYFISVCTETAVRGEKGAEEEVIVEEASDRAFRAYRNNSGSSACMYLWR